MDNLEATTYSNVCYTCGHIFKYESDLCPNCASEDIQEYHIRECSCEDCMREYINIEGE